MPTASNSEKVPMREQLTLICPELMYASLLLLVARETFTAKEPEHQFKIMIYNKVKGYYMHERYCSLGELTIIIGPSNSLIS